MEVGIDIEKIDRFNNLTQKFLQRVFTDSELEYANNFAQPASTLCGMWCAKEAAIKAFDSGINLKDIEVLRSKSGKPYINLTKLLQTKLKALGLSEIKISISHSKDYAIAICNLI